jgi:uncharacterized protein (TIGR02996 family)
MSDRDALFQAILDAPDDDAPRLVFADWLDEHGDAARAEFIRVQCRMARLPFYEAEYTNLKRRADRLLTEHEADWRIEWLPREQVFRRGFVEEMTLSAGLFAGRAGRIFARTPLRWMHFTEAPRDTWLLWVMLHRLQGIDFGGPPFGRPEDWHTHDLPRLRWLKAVGLQPVATFLHVVATPRLEALDLSRSPSTPRQFEDFVYSVHLRNLRALSIDATQEEVFYPHRMRAAGARLIGEAGLTELRQLHLRGQLIGEAGLFHLARSDSLGRLEELYLDRNDIGLIGTTWVEDLCASTTLTRLRVLSLAENPIGSSGIAELAGWPGLRRLRWLNLSNCGLTEAAVRPLIASPYLHEGLTIVLDGNSCSPAELLPWEMLPPVPSLS